MLIGSWNEWQPMPRLSYEDGRWTDHARVVIVADSQERDSGAFDTAYAAPQDGLSHEARCQDATHIEDEGVPNALAQNEVKIFVTQ